MNNFPFVAKIEDRSGRLVPVVRDREQFDGFILRNFKVGQQVWITVRPPSKDRTHQQFKYLYGAVYPLIGESLGCSIEEVDGVMRKRLLTMNLGSPLEFVRNKSDLDRAELSEFIDGVRQIAAGMGIMTPDGLEDKI